MPPHQQFKQHQQYKKALTKFGLNLTSHVSSIEVTKLKQQSKHIVRVQSESVSEWVRVWIWWRKSKWILLSKCTLSNTINVQAHFEFISLWLSHSFISTIQYKILHFDSILFAHWLVHFFSLFLSNAFVVQARMLNFGLSIYPKPFFFVLFYLTIYYRFYTLFSFYSFVRSFVRFFVRRCIFCLKKSQRKCVFPTTIMRCYWTLSLRFGHYNSKLKCSVLSNWMAE